MFDEVNAAQQQDQLRPLRQFISALNTSLSSDQSYAGVDGNVNNPPRQFQVVGPTGTSVEGQPIKLTGDGALTISPALVLVGVGVAIALAMRYVKA